MHAPPVLTAERIDAMLSVMAEVCLESVVEAGQRQKAAEDFEAFERSGRTLQRACRNLRQTIAMKQRFDREEARKVDDARKAADGVRIQAERTKRDAVGAKRARVLRHFERVVWDEYEGDEAHDWLEDLDGRLTDLSEDPDFLETPFETLIQRLADDIGLGEDRTDEPPPGQAQVALDPGREAPQASSPNRRERRDGAARAETSASSAKTSAFSAVESDGSTAADTSQLTRKTPAPAPAEPAEPAPPSVGPPQPPDPPPEPPPKPYLPPWEQLKPGQIMPGGGTGW